MRILADKQMQTSVIILPFRDTNHFFIVTRADPKQELEQELVAVSSSFDAGSEEPACLLIIVISLIIVI